MEDEGFQALLEPVAAPIPYAPPPKVYPTQATAVAAEQWLERYYPGTAFDFRGVDTVAANAVARQWHTLALRYPEAAATVDYVGSGLTQVKLSRLTLPSMMDGIYAQVPDIHATLRQIQLNPKHFGDSEALLKLLARDVRIGWHPPGTESIEGLFTHEFGHVLDGFMRSMHNTAFRPAVMANGFGEVGDVWNVWQGLHQDLLAISSTYAKTNIYEGFAEAFSMLHHAPLDDLTAALRRVTREMRVMLDVLYKPSTWTNDFVDLGKIADQALRQQIGDELRELAKLLGVTL